MCLQKLHEITFAVKKMFGMKQESKKKWLKVLKPEMTSSEESEEEVILIQYLAYRSPE